MARPVFIARAKLPLKREGDEQRWVTIGAAFDANFNNGQGYSVKLHTVPIGWQGDFILIPPLEDNGQ